MPSTYKLKVSIIPYSSGRRLWGSEAEGTPPENHPLTTPHTPTFVESV